ncbi:MAG: metallophosphoesterase [Flavobacteriales bacterium]|jgi:5'-nucleotidase|nr:metallophosphoesterase [Flavobacteriales bacterium]
MKTNRRLFIKRTSLLAGAGLTYSWLPAFGKEEELEKITILHTNDVHSHIDPFPKNHSKFALQGGAAARAHLISTIRKEEKNVLLFDAGDIFQGTPYFNLYKGKLEYDVMNYMKYDAATIGNHDFDIGIDGLKNQLKRAKFSTLVANYDVENTDLQEFIKPYRIFNRSGIKIGVYGLGIEIKGLVPDNLCKGVKYLDPIQQMKETEKQLKEEGCKLIICLSHLGYKYKSNKVSDLALAEEVKYTDLIIGGHTHTFLEKATEVNNKNGKKVLVNQAGWGGLQLGKVEFFVPKSISEKMIHSSNNQHIN